jgi:glutamine amidotransferase
VSNVCILDYGSGNVQSVKNALDRLKISNLISNSVESIRKATHIILPGVGAFEGAMRRIRDTLPIRELQDEVLEKKKPYLGICVGMQVLAERGYENGTHLGLGWIKEYEVVENSKQVRQPHIGWNSVQIRRESPIFNGIDDESDFYFVHSFIMKSKSQEFVIGSTHYGDIFPSVLQKDNIYGVQFHPEKSQENGLKLLRNFTLLV